MVVVMHRIGCDRPQSQEKADRKSLVSLTSAIFGGGGVAVLQTAALPSVALGSGAVRLEVPKGKGASSATANGRLKKTNSGL